MKYKVLPALALLLTFCAASNAAILIDDFSTAQGPLVLTTGSSNSGLFSLSALGGARNISLDVTTSNTPNEATVVVANGTLDYSNSVGVASVLTVIWDGGTDNTLTPNGIATPVDLTQGGANNAIRFSTLGDFALNSTLTLWSGTGNFATWNFMLPSSPTLTDVTLLFGTQTTTTGAFDFTGITAARLIVNGIANADRSIDFINADGPGTGVPEPSTYAMIGAGALALATYSRKRR